MLIMMLFVHISPYKCDIIVLTQQGLMKTFKVGYTVKVAGLL